MPHKLRQYKIDGHRNRSEALYVSNIIWLQNISGPCHISDVFNGVQYEAGINIFAKCLALNITCSSGIEVHI